MQNGKCTHSLNTDHDLNVCEFSRNGKYFFIGGNIMGDLDKAILCYDESSRSLVAELSRNGLKQEGRGHSMRVTNVRADPENENVIYSGGWDNTIKIYDVR